MELQRPREAAALTLSLLDLTNLKEDCTPQQIAALCQRAHTEFGNTAAICIWPRFVAQARAATLEATPVEGWPLTPGARQRAVGCLL